MTKYIHITFYVGIFCAALTLAARILMGVVPSPGWYIWPMIVVTILWGMVGIAYWVGKLDNR